MDRLMYCYEDRITDELIEVMATEPKICHYIDVPIQHSSDHTLKEMKRRSTRIIHKKYHFQTERLQCRI